MELFFSNIDCMINTIDKYLFYQLPFNLLNEQNINNWETRMFKKIVVSVNFNS
jgi:hypothetical protein